MKRKILLVLCLLAQSCIASKDYKMSSYDQRDSLFSSFEQKNKKIRIYLQNSEKFQIEKDSGYPISVSSYCHSKGDIYMQAERVWGEVEVRAMKLGLESKSPVIFVCRPKDADFIYEYSYKEKRELGAVWLLSLMTFLGTFGILPVIESPDYEVSVQIKDKNYILLKDLGATEFGHTTFSSTALIPFVLSQSIKRVPIKESVVAEIVVDKIIGSLPELQQISNKKKNNF